MSSSPRGFLDQKWLGKERKQKMYGGLVKGFEILIVLVGIAFLSRYDVSGELTEI
jgi:hypothetical protein